MNKHIDPILKSIPSSLLECKISLPDISKIPIRKLWLIGLSRTVYNHSNCRMSFLWVSNASNSAWCLCTFFPEYTFSMNDDSGRYIYDVLNTDIHYGMECQLRKCNSCIFPQMIVKSNLQCLYTIHSNVLRLSIQKRCNLRDGLTDNRYFVSF